MLREEAVMLSKMAAWSAYRKRLGVRERVERRMGVAEGGVAWVEDGGVAWVEDGGVG